MATHRETEIHPLAYVEKGAVIGSGVIIEPYAVVKGTVTLGDEVTIKAHAYLEGRTTIGARTTIYPGAVIGTKTQDKKFSGEETFIRIGSDCEIREYVTVNGSCGAGTEVSIGNHSLLMAYCHVAHNCCVGNHVIMSNNATLAGHVTVEDYAIIGGLTPVHQFVRIGTHAMMGGGSRLTEDLPPYFLAGEIPVRLGGINLIGLKRRGFSVEVRDALTKAFKLIYRSHLPLERALEKIEETLPQHREIGHLLAFCRNSQRGLVGLGGVTRVNRRGEQPVEGAAS